MTPVLTKLTCTHCLAPSRTIDAPLSAQTYGRLFPELPALVADESLLWALGGVGGLCDGGLVVDVDGGDDAHDVSAGWPFFGQLIAHDITADRSLPVHQADPATLHNARKPTIDLEFLYGDGPSGNPFLYDRTDSAKMLLGRNDAGQPDDLPRNGKAWRSSGILATTPTSLSPSSTWPCSSCTTPWSIRCVRRECQRMGCSRKRGASPAGIINGWSCTTFCRG